MRTSFLVEADNQPQTLENCIRIAELLKHVDFKEEPLSETAEMGHDMLLREVSSALQHVTERSGDA